WPGARPSTVNDDCGPAKRQRSEREQALPPTTNRGSAAASACSDGFDNVDGSPERGVYIQLRGIEQVRIWRGFHGGGRAAGIALVAAENVVKNVLFVQFAPGLPQFAGPAASA